MKEIVQGGAEVLREIANPVPKELFGTPELTQILENMETALDRELDGVALAAPQIDIPFRIFIVRKDRTVPQPERAPGDSRVQGVKPVVEVYINPEIVKTSRKRSRADEGCLSVRGIYGVTSRHERVTIKAQTPDGKKFERGGGGLLAQIFEHEIDHLNGILFIDHAENLVEVTRDANA
jgi:peptide deformylase